VTTILDLSEVCMDARMSSGNGTGYVILKWGGAHYCCCASRR